MNLMLRPYVARSGAFVSLLLGLLLISGCQSGGSGSGGTTSLGAATGAGGTNSTGTNAPLGFPGEILKAGDILTISFSDLPTSSPAFQERVNDDGTITLQYSETFKAAGKTRQQLQQEIKERYVPKYYKYLTVTITPMLQFYFVGGEVRSPGRYEHVGKMTVRKALQSAGDFTDFANKKKVKLTRATGEKHTINAIKALNNPELDLEVLPGDTLHVPRRIF
jgi:protein involved in polysaccharide export with SLBB domain